MVPETEMILFKSHEDTNKYLRSLIYCDNTVMHFRQENILNYSII